MTTKTRQLSITRDLPQGRPLDSSNLDRTPSPTQVLSMLYVPNQAPSIHHGDQPRGRDLNDSTHTRSTRPTTSYLPTTKPTMMRRFEQACPHSSLPPLQ
jgi:hypothetical protein